LSWGSLYTSVTISLSFKETMEEANVMAVLRPFMYEFQFWIAMAAYLGEVSSV
jgi:hypothetical protein